MLFPSASLREERRRFAMSIQQGLVNTVEAAERLIGEDPDFGPAYLFAGNACMDAGDPDAAEAWFWRGLERQPLQPAIYLALAALRSQRDTQDPFFPALQYLAMAKMGTLTEIPAHFAETFKETADPKTQSEVDFDDPATYQMLATFLEIQEKKAPPPAEVQDRLLPYSLLTRLQEQAGSVVDSMVLQDILDNASRCAPIFHAALKEWARVEASTDETTIAFLMAILAEIGEPSIISDLLEVVLLEHTDLFLHANWAIWRLAQRYPAEALDQFNRAAAGASLPLRCALA